MKAADFLSAAEALPFADLDQIVGRGGIVVVAPHPDDESLGCGGLIAAACARGVDVRLVVVSDGVGSHANSTLYPPARLKALRETETLSAVAALGLDSSNVYFLGLPDAAVPVVGPIADKAVDDIVAIAAYCAATAILVTWHHDPHCDHEASAKLVALAARKLGGVRTLAYPIWGWTLPPDTEVGPALAGARLDITHHVATKIAAIAAHKSQTTALIPDDPDGFRLEPSMLKRFERPFEIFLEVSNAMTRRTETLSTVYFEHLYASDPDPWRFASSAYEAEKYSATLDALSRADYVSALEVGCSIGVLTRQLATCCRSLLALDAAEGALSQARERCRDLPNVSFMQAFVPGEWPTGNPYDLVLLSEIIYYLDRDDVGRLAERVRHVTNDGSDIVLVHWLGLTDFPLSGDEAADYFINCSSGYATIVRQHREERYRIDVLRVISVSKSE